MCVYYTVYLYHAGRAPDVSRWSVLRSNENFQSSVLSGLNVLCEVFVLDVRERERDRQRERGTEGDRETERQRDEEGGVRLIGLHFNTTGEAKEEEEQE